MPTLWLLRHGESVANAQSRFTGWLDEPLTARGMGDARTAGALLAEAGCAPQVVHTSLLRRTIVTADIVLNVLGRDWVPVVRSWRLNERHYEALTGLTKSAVIEQAGAEQFARWRRSRSERPPALDPASPLAEEFAADPRYAGLGRAVPLTESLADVTARLVPHWLDRIIPDLRAGRSPLVVAHGNTLRALIAYLEQLDDGAVEALNVPTGAPLRYDLDTELAPVTPGGRYLDEAAALTRAAAVAAEGHQSAGRRPASVTNDHDGGTTIA